MQEVPATPQPSLSPRTLRRESLYQALGPVRERGAWAAASSNSLRSVAWTLQPRAWVPTAAPPVEQPAGPPANPSRARRRRPQSPRLRALSAAETKAAI